VVVLNKADLVPEDLRDELVEAFVETSGATPTALISGATGEGIRELLEAVWAVVHATDLDRDPAQRQTSR
jgi:GTPase involved in cell partitioning and DNA repair